MYHLSCSAGDDTKFDYRLRDLEKRKRLGRGYRRKNYEHMLIKMLDVTKNKAYIMSKCS